MATNRLRQILENNEFALGTFMQFPSPEIVEVLGYTGFDFLIPDLEHSTYETSQIAMLARAGKSVNLPSLVRMWGVDPRMIIRVLDIGVEGVHFPRVSSEEEAKSIVKYVRMPPIGERGVCPETREGHYLSLPLDDYERRSTDVVIGVMIETKEGLENVEKILAVPGIDLVQMGPYDLAFSLGLPTKGRSVGDVCADPIIVEANERVIKAAEANGVKVMQFTSSVEDVSRKLEANPQHRIFWYLTDGIMITHAFRDVTRKCEALGFRK
ncbi:HpcH/HpaI aldolase family protein [Caballeronia sp. J97]|uniref:HpcH/HpaI aldolase family protein n=1 Tax=Caballeronia sp. J97 TaxID=2805429 RepID=UPI002AAF7A3D|nr:aldolase/citrate lyase family protein [Caballeronia sp. J97]